MENILKSDNTIDRFADEILELINESTGKAFTKNDILKVINSQFNALAPVSQKGEILKLKHIATLGLSKKSSKYIPLKDLEKLKLNQGKTLNELASECYIGY